MNAMFKHYPNGMLWGINFDLERLSKIRQFEHKAGGTQDIFELLKLREVSYKKNLKVDATHETLQL